MLFLVLSIVVLMVISPANGKGKDKLINADQLWNEEEVVYWVGCGEERLSTVVIGGKLLCSADSNAKLSRYPYPVSGSSVAVFCGTSGRRRKSWAKGSTNGYGEFLIDLPSHLHSIPNLEKICVVKVLHLPKSSPCRHSFTGKHKGIKLTSISEGVRIYTTNNIHLMPKPSQEPARDEARTSVL